jgi:hypothetical protein
LEHRVAKISSSLVLTNNGEPIDNSKNIYLNQTCLGRKGKEERGAREGERRERGEREREEDTTPKAQISWDGSALHRTFLCAASGAQYLGVCPDMGFPISHE